MDGITGIRETFGWVKGAFKLKSNQRNWEYSESQIWKISGDAITLYHVFGLTTTKSGVVLAFCEAREGAAADAGAHHLFMRRSLDQGRTFGEHISLIPLEGDTCNGNPLPVADMETGRVYFFWSVYREMEGSLIYRMHSDDDGLTWSNPQMVNDLFDNSDVPRPFHCPSPGHGIQIQHGPYAGRLIAPFWHRQKTARDPAPERGYCASTVYSDDHGATWKNGEFSGMTGFLNETRIAEVLDENGESLLILQGRSLDNHPHRQQMFSRDGGITWTMPGPMPVDPATVCDAGILSFSDGDKMQNTLLVSRVSHLKKRQDMEILISLNGGKSYEMKFLLPRGDAMPGYSDLTLLPDGTIGLLHARHDHILFSRISLETLTNGWYSGTRRNVFC